MSVTYGITRAWARGTEPCWWPHCERYLVDLEGLCVDHGEDERWILFGSRAACRVRECELRRDTLIGVCCIHEEQGWDDLLLPLVRQRPAQEEGQPDIDLLVEAIESGMPTDWLIAWVRSQRA